jgi:hypothetical protein
MTSLNNALKKESYLSAAKLKGQIDRIRQINSTAAQFSMVHTTLDVTIVGS